MKGHLALYREAKVILRADFAFTQWILRLQEATARIAADLEACSPALINTAITAPGECTLFHRFNVLLDSRTVFIRSALAGLLQPRA